MSFVVREFSEETNVRVNGHSSYRMLTVFVYLFVCLFVVYSLRLGSDLPDELRSACTHYQCSAGAFYRLLSRLSLHVI